MQSPKTHKRKSIKVALLQFADIVKQALSLLSFSYYRYLYDLVVKWLVILNAKPKALGSILIQEKFFVFSTIIDTITFCVCVYFVYNMYV